MMRLEQIQPPSVPGTSRFALWDLGFRPFYLLASAFSALSVLMWALQWGGWLPYAYLQGPMWHAHEMLFGFTLAVVTGFLLTAGQNWTGQPTPKGPYLAALAALWVAGRITVLLPWGWLAALVNVAFPLAVALSLAMPLIRARNRRNYFFVGLLVLMAVGQAAVHLNALQLMPLPGWAGIALGLDVMLFVISVMGGRVIPMFTNNGVPGARAERKPWVERFALGSVLVLWLADAGRLSGSGLILISLAAMLAHGLRLWYWQSWKTFKTPLVWVLHLAYAWIPVHLGLRAAAEIGWVALSVAQHALTTGAIGGMVIGMMTRTAMGHTGRKLVAGRTEQVCYGLVAAAALVRVVLPALAPALTGYAVMVSAGLWSGGFGLYAVRYWPVLSRPA